MNWNRKLRIKEYLICWVRGFSGVLHPLLRLIGYASMIYNTLFFPESGSQLILKHHSWYLRTWAPVLGASPALQHFQGFSSKQGKFLFHRGNAAISVTAQAVLRSWKALQLSSKGTSRASILSGRDQKITMGAGGCPTKQTFNRW